MCFFSVVLIKSIIEDIVVQANASLEGGTRLALLLDEMPWWLDELRKAGTDDDARTALAKLRSMRQQEDGPAMILTGSVGLEAVAEAIGALPEINDLIPPIEVGPLGDAAGKTLFETELIDRGIVCEPDAAHLAHSLTGGSPHWLKVLARRVHKVPAAVPQDIEEACADLLSPGLRRLFLDEGNGHFRRRYEQRQAAMLITILTATAQHESVAQPAILAAVLGVSTEWSREQIQAGLYTLVDEFYLDGRGGQFSFINPLLRRWWLKYGGES